MRRICLAVLIMTTMVLLMMVSHGVESQEAKIKIIWREDKDQYYVLSRYSMLADDLKKNNIEVTNYSVEKEFSGKSKPPSADHFGDPSSTIIVIPNPPSEFSEVEMRRWLSLREITGKHLDRLVDWLARTVLGSNHKIVSVKYSGDGYHFRFNSMYIRMRERFRERIRGRGYI